MTAPLLWPGRSGSGNTNSCKTHSSSSSSLTPTPLALPSLPPGCADGTPPEEGGPGDHTDAIKRHCVQVPTPSSGAVKPHWRRVARTTSCLRDWVWLRSLVVLTKPVDDARGATALGGQSYHHHRPPYSYSQQAVVVVVFVVGISRADTGTLGLSTCLLLAIHSLSLLCVSNLWITRPSTTLLPPGLCQKQLCTDG